MVGDPHQRKQGLGARENGRALGGRSGWRKWAPPGIHQESPRPYGFGRMVAWTGHGPHHCTADLCGKGGAHPAIPEMFVLGAAGSVYGDLTDPVRVSGRTGLYDEMLVLEALLPAVATDLRAQIDGVVTASDACETGGGATYASRLSRMGVEELEQIMEEGGPMEQEVASDFRDTEQKVVIIDLLAGIGGLERALQHAKLKPWFVVAVESDPDCRRCVRRKFPGWSCARTSGRLTGTW